MRRAVAALCAGVVVGGLLLSVPGNAAPVSVSTPRAPLSGLTIALDPGHQLGNSNPAFRKQLAQTRFNGTVTKSCNTTGTATPNGYPEATFVWNVSRYAKKRLEGLGAKVRMTRTANRYDRWGPCVWVRGAFGAKVNADLLVSVHADGAPASGRGFFVIVPGVVPGWTDDIAAPSQRMGQRMITGMRAAGATPSTYIRGQMLVWRDVTTLNFSDVPAVLVELGNMRNPTEARVMRTSSGQRRYAEWLVAGIRAAVQR